MHYLCPLHVLYIHQRPQVSCAAHRVALPVHVISSAHTHMCTRLLLDSRMHTHACTIMTVSPAYQDPVHMHVIYLNINAHMYDAAHHHYTRVKHGNRHVHQTHNTRDTCLLFRILSFSSYHVRVAMFLHITHAKSFTLSHACERKTTFFHTGLPNDGMCT